MQLGGECVSASGPAVNSFKCMGHQLCKLTPIAGRSRLVCRHNKRGSPHNPARTRWPHRLHGRQAAGRGRRAADARSRLQALGPRTWQAGRRRWAHRREARARLHAARRLCISRRDNVSSGGCLEKSLGIRLLHRCADCAAAPRAARPKQAANWQFQLLKSGACDVGLGADLHAGPRTATNARCRLCTCACREPLRALRPSLQPHHRTSSTKCGAPSFTWFNSLLLGPLSNASLDFSRRRTMAG